MKRHFLKDKQTTNVANSLGHFDDTVLSQSNVVGFAHILGSLYNHLNVSTGHTIHLLSCRHCYLDEL